MTEVHARLQNRHPPRSPVVFVAVMAALAVLSIITGIVDIVLPKFTGEEPFALLYRAVAVLGPAYLFVHILVHNAGLACLVPGIGLLALSFERDRRMRVLGARILFATSVVALLVAFQFLLQASEKFDLALALPLLAVEGAAVLLLSWRGYRALREFVPTPRKSWAFVHPARELAPWFAGTFAVLALAAVVEVAVVMGTMPDARKIVAVVLAAVGA